MAALDERLWLRSVIFIGEAMLRLLACVCGRGSKVQSSFLSPRFGFAVPAARLYLRSGPARPLAATTAPGCRPCAPTPPRYENSVAAQARRPGEWIRSI